MKKPFIPLSLHILTYAMLCCAVALLNAVPGVAQNPIISGQFTADPTARVFNGKVYLYPSHDIHSPVARLKDWFCMEDYHVFSSDNLTDWRDHGVILTQNRIPWVQPDSYAMWAPDCVCKDGRYYLYFPAAPKEPAKGFNIGVAVADSPEGPFMPMFRPIEGIGGIDPCVLVDDDGRSYIYWSGRGMSGAPLKENMMELDGEPVAIEGLPEGFKEGPFVFKKDGNYYFTFPWVEKKTEKLAYAMGKSPLGPFEFKGVIMDESPVGCWTNHHSIVEYEGDWYLFYHHNDYSPDMDKRRSARIDSISFNPDGTIAKVTPTFRGVGITDARRRIQIDRYSEISPKGVKIDFLNPEDRFEGWKASFKGKGAWLRYSDVDFGDRSVEEITMRARSRKGGTIGVAYGDGSTKLADVDVPSCEEWSSVRIPLSSSPEGVTDLYLSHLGGGEIEIDWIGFDALPFEEGAMTTGRYRNYFAELGYPQEEIDRRLESIFNSLFYGPRKIYFEVGVDMAYVSDVKNNDVRTEGMSYGMMVAVQLDKKEIFDRLWRWAKKHMQHQEGPMKAYFAWSCKTDGTKNAGGAASDGELYFITSLIFASNRWGNDTGIDYLAEARNILDLSMQKVGMDNAAPLIDIEHRLITFTPDRIGAGYTDPSYHLPAFYEVWAEWAGDGRSRFWKECARESRKYLHKAVHPVTGLTPDYSNYDGSLRKSAFIIGDAFRFDSWRVPMNIALDYSWSGEDGRWQREYADRIQEFLYSQGIDEYVDQYNIDGTPVKEVLGAGGYTKLRHSLGLVSTLGAVSLAATDLKNREFVNRVWTASPEPTSNVSLEPKSADYFRPYSDGYIDTYYDGLLHLFAFLHLSGRYRLIPPTR